MLKEAIKIGFKNVKGIEPSKEAINYADEELKNLYIVGFSQMKISLV